MRLLWLAHAPDPETARAADLPHSGSGFWTYSLAEALIRARPDLELTIVTHASVRQEVRRSGGGIHHLVLPEKRHRETRSCPSPALVEQIGVVVREVGPDLLHVHGLEKNYGLLTDRFGLPSLVSIHGLLHRASRYWLAGLSPGELLRCHSLPELLRARGPLPERLRLFARARLEKEVILRNHVFIGATDWDRAHVLALNPWAHYHRIVPALRPQFFARRWSWEGAEPDTLFTSVAAYPLKGLHILFRALALLRRRTPSLKLRLAGSFPDPKIGYHRFLLGEIARLDLIGGVEPLGFLGPAALVEELVRARAVVVPSFLENFSTTLIEAMAVGTPAVAAYTGGLTSVAPEEVSALFFVVGDEAHLAHQLGRLLSERGTAVKLSEAARCTAAERHGPEVIATTTLDLYRHLVF